MRVLLFAPCLLVTSALADVAGTATVIDGDTPEIHGRRIRLHSIDAPETRQLYFIDGKRWQCGKDAVNILADFINRRSDTCQERNRDCHGRIAATCYAASEDLNAWMVSQGLALAYRRYSLNYVDEEADAKAARRGIPVAPPFVRSTRFSASFACTASIAPDRRCPCAHRDSSCLCARSRRDRYGFAASDRARRGVGR